MLALASQGPERREDRSEFQTSNSLGLSTVIAANPTPSEDEAPRTGLRLREKGTDKVHIYDAWASEESAPEDGPDWLSGTINRANVSKRGIEHLDG